MADDVVDTIAQYDLDDDFPDYANEQNKELNQIVRINKSLKSKCLTLLCALSSLRFLSTVLSMDMSP
jgi:hypothetical protein